MKQDHRVEFVLQVGLAFALLYPAVNALFDPFAWIGFFPPFVRGIVPDFFLLNAFGALEAALAIWLLSGWRILIPSFVTLILLVSIVLFNLPQFQIVFRDLALAAMALALILSRIRR